MKGGEALNRAYPIRSLTEGATMSGVFILLAIITYYSPIGTILLLAMSAPTAILVLRHNWKVGLLSAVSSLLLLLMLLDPIYVLTGCLTLQFTGLILGISLRNQWGPWTSVLTTSVACLLGFLFLIAASSLIFDINYIDEMIGMYRQASVASLDLAQQFNLPEEQITLLQRVPELIETVFTTLFPMLLVLSSFINALLNYQVMVLLGKRMNFTVRSLPPFQTWRLPDWFGLGYVVAFIANWLGQTQSIAPLVMTADNIYQLFYFLLQVQGISVSVWYLLKFNVSPIFRWLVLLFLYLNPYLAFIAILVGLADLIFDLRRLTPRRRLPPPEILPEETPQ